MYAILYSRFVPSLPARKAIAQTCQKSRKGSFLKKAQWFSALEPVARALQAKETFSSLGLRRTKFPAPDYKKSFAELFFRKATAFLRHRKVVFE